MARSSEGPPDVRGRIRDINNLKSIPKRHWEKVFSGSGSVPPGSSPEHLASWGSRQAAKDFLGSTANGRTVDPFAALPRTPTTKQFQAISEFWQESARQYDEGLSEEGWKYTNYGSDTGYDKKPSRITVVPTSTTNAKRPRTVAAGWQARTARDLGTLTVVFRDGTYYNYYDVDYREWQDFKSMVSKGHYIANFLDSKPRGPAELGAVDARVRAALELIYVTGRASQKYSYRSGTKRVTDPVTGKRVSVYRNKQGTAGRYRKAPASIQNKSASKPSARSSGTPRRARANVSRRNVP